MATTQSHAIWQGSLKEGKGTMTLPKGNYTGPFTRASRFETGEGTNPEELIGAALAGCYSMFLSALLSNNNTPPEHIETTASVTIGDGPKITTIELVTKAKVAGLDDAEFQEFAQKAKAGCPVSQALAGVDEISLEASLLS